MNEKEAMIRLKMLEQQAAQAEQRLAQLNTIIQENELTISSVEQLDKSEQGYSTLGSGVYAKSKITDKDIVLLNLGVGILAEVKTERAKKYLEQAQENLQKEQQNLVNMLNQIQEKYSDIINEQQKG